MFLNDRIRERTGSVITSDHPTLGPLYVEYVSEYSVGGPDYYSLSLSMERAMILEPGWASNRDQPHVAVIASIMRDQAVEYADDDNHIVELKGGLAVLHAYSGQCVLEFLDWLKSARWAEAPGPVRIEHLIDQGYFSEWQTLSQTYPIPLAT